MDSIDEDDGATDDLDGADHDVDDQDLSTQVYLTYCNLITHCVLPLLLLLALNCKVYNR